MNVLLVVPWDQAVGGVASVVGNVARQLRKAGHQVWFLHPGEASSLKTTVTKWNFPGYELNLRNPFVKEAPVKSVLGFLFYLPHTLHQLHTLLIRHNIDIVNIHYPIGSGVYFALLRHFSKFKLVISVHGGDLFPKGVPERRYPKALEILINSADWLVAPSKNTLDAALTRFPELQATSSAIHNAVDLTEFDMEERDALQGGRFILCIALLQPRKAVDVLIKAVQLLVKTYPDVELWLAGDGPLRGQLEDLVSQLDLNQKVKFLGSQDRVGVKKLLRQCTLLVLPSRAEPFGIAILEAFSSKKPVVASAVGGIPEIIENGQNGILVEPENPQALCDAISKVWTDPALAEQLASAGYQTVRKHFQWEVASARYEAIFMNLLG